MAADVIVNVNVRSGFVCAELTEISTLSAAPCPWKSIVESQLPALWLELDPMSACELSTFDDDEGRFGV